MISVVAMGNDKTQEKSDARPFEERVFARFDTLDQRLASLEDRVDTRLKDTRPIWEAVLARLDSIDTEIKAISRRVRVLHDDLLHAREVQEELRERVSKLDSETTNQ